MTLQPATEIDAQEISGLHIVVADRLTRDFGNGAWSRSATEHGVLVAMRRYSMFIARHDRRIIGVLSLGRRKPWAINQSFFTGCARPLYLTGMAIHPDFQRRALGRAMIAEAVRFGRAWPADALRLDAYDAPAGAGEFYARCGFREVGRTTYRGAALIYYELLLGANSRS